MPWCPVCKNEYREGITVCAECQCALVEQLEEEEFQPFIFGEQDKMERLQKFLSYESHRIETKLAAEEEENVYSLAVRQRDRKNAVKAAQVFLSQEAQEELAETEQPEETGGSGEEEGAYRYYQNSAAQAQDNRSSAYTLLIVGGIGFLAVLLIFFNVTPLYRTAGITRYMVCGILGAMSILFIVFGILSMRSSRVLQVRAKMENSLLTEITGWCEANLSAEEIDSGLFEGEEMPEEQKYFLRAEKMKKLISDKFMNLDAAFLEHFVDEYYQRLFEGK